VLVALGITTSAPSVSVVLTIVWTYRLDDAEGGGCRARSQGARRPDGVRSEGAPVRAAGDVLGCETYELDFGLSFPVLLVSFPDGSRFSVEFSGLAPAEPAAVDLDDAAALRGAWIEFRTADVDRYQERLREAGIPEFRHAGSPHQYFSAPGGQVFRLIDIAYTGP